MRLTTFTDYSLRLLMFLASAPEARASVAEVARAFGISEHHLVKVAHFLGREGILRTTRGRHGGLRLARAPDEINLGRLVRLTEGGDRPAECFDRETNTCRLSGNCQLQGALKQALDSFYASLERHTLADLQVPRTLARIFRLERLRP